MGTNTGVPPTLGEVCAELGITRKTLAKWLARLEISPARHPRDWRFYTLTPEQVATIRDARAEMPALAIPADRQHVPPVLPVAAYPARPQPSESALRSVQGHIAQNRPFTPPEGRQPLPTGWISFNHWCASHGVNHRAVQQEIARGQLPTPERGRWWQRPQMATLSAYSAEQHIAAARFAALRWSDRFTACDVCRPHLATLPGRATAPTVPIGARRGE